MMNFLYQSAFAEALGWSIIDTLWQMGTTWLFYIMITGDGTRFTSQQRHSLALAGSAVGMILFIISFIFNYYTVPLNKGYLNVSWINDVIPLISSLYLPAVMFFGLRLIVQVSRSKNVYRKNLVEADSRISALVREMCERCGIVKSVSVWISDKVESPLTVGCWKPAIFLPVALFTQLSCRQVEAVIMHELHHIKRNDYIINIFLAVADVILFFNPFAQMMFATVKKERENSCDDYVIASGFDAWEYSQALYIVGRYRNEKSSLAIAAAGEGKEYLLQRIKRMMKRNDPSPSVLKPLSAFFLCLFVAAFAVRQKQIAASPEAVITKVEPAVFYLEEKNITITSPEKVSVPKEYSVTTRKRKASDTKKDIRITPEPVAPDEPPVPPSHLIFNTYVAAPQLLEFTIIDPVTVDVPDITCESPHPYIQQSSFYFTEIDTIAGKKVIVL